MLFQCNLKNFMNIFANTIMSIPVEQQYYYDVQDITRQ